MKRSCPIHGTSRLWLTAVLVTASLLVARVDANPEIPGATPKSPVALVGGTLHPVSGLNIADGVLVMEDGRIAAIGDAANTEIPQNAVVIDVAGKHVYPGLFEAYSNLGLVEINAVRATDDESEVGRVNPNVKAQVAVNPDSELIPVTRSNGVLLAVTAPSGGLIAGKSAILQLDGWTWEDMTVKADVGLHVNWPRMATTSSWLDKRSSDEQTSDRDSALDRLQQTFDDARAYAQARAANPEQHPIDLRWQAMLPVLDGQLPLIVAADGVQQIQAAVAMTRRENVRMILHGGYDALECAELLKKYDIPVIVSGVYRLPERRWEPYDAPFTLPQRLRAAGIRFCISGSGRFGASNVRNLPYHAAMAAAFGLSEEEALKAITLYPAQILGVDDRVGSLETGKDATLFVSDGDALETATHVEAAYVQGRPVELNDRHKRLWKKYEEKYRRQTSP